MDPNETTNSTQDQGSEETNTSESQVAGNPYDVSKWNPWELADDPPVRDTDTYMGCDYIPRPRS